MDPATLAQILSSFATLIVVLGILYQGRQARKARDDAFRPQIMVDADYTGRFTTNVVARNIGGGAAKDIKFEFSDCCCIIAFCRTFLQAAQFGP